VCLQGVSREGAFSESRMNIGDLRAFYFLHWKIEALVEWCKRGRPLTRIDRFRFGSLRKV
jgi:hypothetical protein